ncbi:MAG: sec-independent protein translocase protein TatB [Streptosporangiaceae bacterium]|jgi:sec-independent protein translocase protein TatB|nr:sec-independent translocation protein [Streptosporangiaceae bacterium]MDX6431197.1 sec-independent protein translocase protein TatB [Streptosporangiaceae bacterium]
MFDIGIVKAALLAVLALVIFGDKLPGVAAQAGRVLRQVRAMADNATADLKEGLGPEFADFDPADLHPRRFVQKHLFGDAEEATTAGGFVSSYEAPASTGSASPNGGRPPFDREAT